MSEIKTPPIISTDGSGNDYVTFGPQHSVGDVARWLQASGSADEIVSILRSDATPQVVSSKYQRQIRDETVDVYDVLSAFGVTNSGLQHAVKKLLAPGKRGHKNFETDCREAIQAIERAIQIGRDYGAD